MEVDEVEEDPLPYLVSYCLYKAYSCQLIFPIGEIDDEFIFEAIMLKCCLHLELLPWAHTNY